MADKKPGFFDGLMDALSSDEEKVESEELTHCKEFIDNIELSDADRFTLAGWLFGNTLGGQIASALKDD